MSGAKRFKIKNQKSLQSQDQLRVISKKKLITAQAIKFRHCMLSNTLMELTTMTPDRTFWIS